MKTICYCGVILTLATFSTPARANPLASPVSASVCTVLERGPDHQVVQNLVFATNSAGDVLVETNLYTTLETGMHFQEQENGPWLESRSEFVITPEGAAATQGRHKVYLPANLNQGEIRLITADGKTLRSRPLGLCYFDSQTGQSVLLAELKDSVGQLVAPARVVWPDAFTDIRAEVVATYSKAGFECDVVLRSAPPPPEAFGMNSQSSHLQVISEFFDPPAPQKLAQPPSQRNELTNEDLDFGAMRMVKGKSFMVGDPVADSDMVPVAKQWLKLDGRDCLIESIPVRLIQAQLEALRAAALPAGQANAGMAAIGHRPSLQRLLPVRRVAQASRGPPMQVARAALDSEPGLAIDYLMLNSSHTVLKGDQTYLLLNHVYFTSLVIEGGVVVKSTNSVAAQIHVSGTLDCQTDGFRPAIFTSMSDDTVGEEISDSQHNPQGYYGNGLALSSSGQTVRHVRFAYADRAITLEFDEGQFNLAHSQFVQCKYPLYASSQYGDTLDVDNCLFYLGSAVLRRGDDMILRGRHLTVNQCGQVGSFQGSGSGELYLTNSLVVAMPGGYGNFYVVETNSTLNLNPDPGVFQTVGAGSHYLADDTYRDLGNADLAAWLLVDLKRMTTFPPNEFSTAVTVDWCLPPYAKRDYDKPDLGYHYYPLDHVVNNLTVNNDATLKVLKGAVIGVYGASGVAGLNLQSGGKLISVGSPTDLCRFVRYNMVQEQATLNWSSSSVGPTIKVAAATAEAEFRFTSFSIPGGSGDHFNATVITSKRPSFTDCQLSGGAFTITPCSVGLTNCLWERVQIRLDDQSESVSWHLFNNLFRGGSFYYQMHGEDPVALAEDNFFDQTTITKGGGSEDFTHGHNGYITGSSRLTPTQGSDQVVSSANFQTGPLGRYYLPVGSVLINNGSRTASAARLAHYTTLVSQAQEWTDPADPDVDIGLHYAPVMGVSEIPKSSIVNVTSLPSNTDNNRVINGLLTEPGDEPERTVWKVALESVPCAQTPSGWLRLDLGNSQPVTRFAYYSDANPVIGTVFDYDIYVTDNPNTWGAAVASGSWGWRGKGEPKTVVFPPKTGRYVYLKCVKGASDNFKVNEVWVYKADSTSTFFVPVDTDNNGTDDYLEDWDLGVTFALPQQVPIVDSDNDLTTCCPGGSGCSNAIQKERRSSQAAGGSSGVDYTFAISVTGNVEQRDKAVDIVSVLSDDNCLEFGETSPPFEYEFYFLEGNDCDFLTCAFMILKSNVMKSVTLHSGDTVHLQYDTGDPLWHKNAYAVMNSALQTGAAQPSLP